MQFSNILVPVDGSDDALFACRVAEQLTAAIPGKETITLLYCVDPIPALIGGQQRAELEAQHKAESAKIFEAARSLLQHSDLNLKTAFRYGAAGQTIADTATELDCTLIIMGTRGRGELKSLALGSVSHDVLHKADVPVLLANKTHLQTRR